MNGDYFSVPDFTDYKEMNLPPEDRRTKAFPLHPEEPMEEAKALTFSLLKSIANFANMKQLLLISLTTLMSATTIHAQEDPYLWLEEVDGKKALEFVKKENALTLEKLSAYSEYQDIYDKSLEIYNSTDRIAYPKTYGDHIYNFWKDKDHVRGIWRRSPKADYLNKEPKWEILLDLDAMSEKDGVKWVFKGASGLYPSYDRFIINLSKGGGDATEKREYDIESKSFIDNGFFIPESKGDGHYIDENTLLVGSDFGEGSMTSSGYPNQVRIWKRGTELSSAKLIHEGAHSDVGSWAFIDRDGEDQHLMIRRSTTFYTGKNLIWKDNKLIEMDLPEDADIKGILKGQLVVDLKSDWKVDGSSYSQGSIVSLDLNALLKGEHKTQLILEPDEFSSVSRISTTQNRILVNLLRDVSGELYSYSFSDGKWSSQKIDAPAHGTISIIDRDESSDDFSFQFENFLTPSTLFTANAVNGTFSPLKSLSDYFDGSKYEVSQIKTPSKDGTLVPYFLVSRKGMKYDGTQPTLLYAYGGFEVSVNPFYSGTFGKCWLDKGGVFVLANIRGGGEYGPKWHQAGLKEKRQHVYDDFHAVAEDLIAQKITSPEHLGIMGGSNGGLLVGVAFTQRPDLYDAVVCQVPLLDMKRYNKLLAGASWMGEYGDPDIPEEWAFIQKYSPYQNLREGVDYPEVFFYTSTRDDRVHPGHARKMVAKMKGMGYPVYYYENTEGGHAGSSTNEQSARSSAMNFSYLLMKLRD